MSKRRMDPYRVYRHRPAGGVVSRIDDELIVETERRPLPERVRVIGLERFLRAVVESTIADQDSQSGGGEVGAGDRGQAAHHDMVMWPAPPLSLQDPSQRPALAAIRPAEDLILSGTPTRA